MPLQNVMPFVTQPEPPIPHQRDDIVRELITLRTLYLHFTMTGGEAYLFHSVQRALIGNSMHLFNIVAFAKLF